MHGDFVSEIYSEDEIEAFLSETKPVAEGQLPLGWEEKRGHKEASLKVTGERGNDYRVVFRQNLRNQNDFSVILGLKREEKTGLVHLRRYNGRSHEHTNPIEDETFFDFHIHRITERYQRRNPESVEKYAEPTDRYSSLREATECLFKDCAFNLEKSSDQLTLFENRGSSDE